MSGSLTMVAGCKIVGTFLIRRFKMQGKWWKLICVVLLVGLIVGVATFAGRHDKANADEAEFAVAADGTLLKVEATLDDDDEGDDDDEDDDDEDDDDEDDDDEDDDDEDDDDDDDD